MTIDWATASEAYKRDGAVRLPGLLSGGQLDAARKAWEWSLANPTPPNAAKLKRDGSPLFYADSYHPRVLEGYRDMLEASPIPEACARLWGTDPVWFIYEQVFLKEGGDTGRTPWHQDGSYIPMDGEDTATAWITFDALAKADSLEFVRGSHLGTVYNTSRFDRDDETIPHDESLPYPRLPRIDAERDKWEIISWPVEPGDVVFFHFRTLHGGAPTRPGQRRRTLTLRFFGDRTHYDPKSAKALPNFPDMATKLKPGDTMRAPGFLQLHPKMAALAPAEARTP
jgi:ectoine hydroxylase-related dioxygenase (phytanoyl-CoA dioxygenase family)